MGLEVGASIITQSGLPARRASVVKRGRILFGCFSCASPKQRPMCLQLWYGDRPCGGPGTHGRSARSFPSGIAKLFTDQVVPSGGVSGAILVARGLMRRGIPTKVAMAELLVGLVSYFAPIWRLC